MITKYVLGLDGANRLTRSILWALPHGVCPLLRGGQPPITTSPMKSLT